MYADTFNALQQRMIHACKRVEKIRERMDLLAAPYHEFLDLKEQLEEYTKQIDQLKGVLGPAFYEAMRTDKTDAIGNVSEISPTWKEIRESMPLWVALRVYLSAAGEARVGEAEEFLNFLKFPNVRRQSIESALSRHKNVFRVRKRGREKFISLKGQ